MHGKFGLLSQEKASSHNKGNPALVFLSFFFLSAVFSSFHNKGCDAYSFTTDGYGIFNVCINLGACRTHEEGSGTNKSAQKWTRRDRREKQICITLPSQGIEPRGHRI